MGLSGILQIFWFRCSSSSIKSRVKAQVCCKKRANLPLVLPSIAISYWTSAESFVSPWAEHGLCIHSSSPGFAYMPMAWRSQCSFLCCGKAYYSRIVHPIKGIALSMIFETPHMHFVLGLDYPRGLQNIIVSLLFCWIHRCFHRMNSGERHPETD